MTELVTCEGCAQKTDIDETVFMDDAIEPGYYCEDCEKTERRMMREAADPKNHPANCCGCNWH